jgi:N utilization substance protein A
VQAVVAELGGEKIDDIEWFEDASAFVAKALSPAQVIEVRIDEEHRIANVVVPERMLSLAIGREGQNARLAAKLTGWRIDIRSDVSVAEAARTDHQEEAAAAVLDTELVAEAAGPAEVAAVAEPAEPAEVAAVAEPEVAPAAESAPVAPEGEPVEAVPVRASRRKARAAQPDDGEVSP